MLFRKHTKKDVNIGPSYDADRAMEKDMERLFELLREIAYETGYVFNSGKKASVVLMRKDGKSYDLVDLLSIIIKKLNIRENPMKDVRITLDGDIAEKGAYIEFPKGYVMSEVTRIYGTFDGGLVVENPEISKSAE